MTAVLSDEGTGAPPVLPGRAGGRVAPAAPARPGRHWGCCPTRC